MTIRSTEIRSVGKRLALLGAALASGFAAGPAFAASDGLLGATSTGTVGISASVPSRVQITGLADVAFTNQDPASDATRAQNVCVWSNTAGRSYTIRASGDGGAGNLFTLTNGTGTVPYTVEWAATSGQTSGTQLATGVASAAQASTAVSPTCAAAPATRSSLIIKMASTDLLTMTSGSSYTGTLTLLVTPQ